MNDGQGQGHRDRSSDVLKAEQRVRCTSCRARAKQAKNKKCERDLHTATQGRADTHTKSKIAMDCARIKHIRHLHISLDDDEHVRQHPPGTWAEPRVGSPLLPTEAERNDHGKCHREDDQADDVEVFYNPLGDSVDGSTRGLSAYPDARRPLGTTPPRQSKNFMSVQAAVLSNV